jgi:phage baseplate assembly protein W
MGVLDKGLSRELKIDERYSDLDMSFSIHPLTGDVKHVKGRKAVVQSVKRLVLMNKWSVPFHPEINCGVENQLFETMGAIHVSAFQNQITEILQTYEPRIKLEKVDCKVKDSGQSLEINITFEIIALDETVTTTLIMKRER